MKSVKKLTIAFAAAVLLLFAFADAKAADPWHHHHKHGRWASYGPSYTSYAPAGVTLQVFYDQLAPYGTWINDPYYGYVWVPAVDAGFRPYYTNGYWAYTDYGNTWVSYYDWGWAPFHYGRWTYDAYYGWIWVPDTVWGPAWVGWRSSADFYGWAPLAPGWGVSFSAYTFPSDWWVFCPPSYVYDRHFYWHCNEPRYNTTIINNTVIVNNTYVTNNTTYIAGPSSADYERHTGQKPQMYQLRELNQAGATRVQNNQIELYRPQVSKAAMDKQVAPANAIKAERSISKPEAISVNKGQPQFKSDAKQLELNKNLQPAERSNPGNAKPGLNEAKPAQGETQKQNMGEPKKDMQRSQPQRLEMDKEPGRLQPKAQPEQKQQMQQQPQQRGWQQQEPQRQQPKQQFEQPKQQPKQQFEQPRQEQVKPQFEPRQAPSRGEPQMQPRQQFEPRQQQFEQPRQQFEQPRQMPMQQQRPQMQPQHMEPQQQKAPMRPR